MDPVSALHLIQAIFRIGLPCIIILEADMLRSEYATDLRLTSDLLLAFTQGCTTAFQDELKLHRPWLYPAIPTFTR